MKKLVKNGLLLLLIILFVLFYPLLGNQVVLANEEDEAVTEENYTPEERTAAIKAANDAILLIPSTDFIISAEQQEISALIVHARSLVEIAKSEFDAVDSDFAHLGKLLEAEKKFYKLQAIKAARDAVDAIPASTEVNEEYIAAVEYARQLVDIAMEEHGATYFDICWRYDALEEAERRVDEEPREPKPIEPKPEPRPTPPTGGFHLALALGFIISGAGILLAKQHRKEKM